MKTAMKVTMMLTMLTLIALLLTPTASASYYDNSADIQQRVIDEAKRQNIAPSLALAIAKVESNFNPKALSHAGAKGVMQIMPRTAEQEFGVHRNRLFDPDVNIRLGVKFIKNLLTRYDGRLNIALSHYNGGSGVKNRYNELNVMPSTRDYVDKVLATQQEFLHYDQQSSLASPVNRSGIQYIDTTSSQNLAYLHEFDLVPEDPQIKALRALRLHNITRNYKGKSALSLTGKPTVAKSSPRAHISQSIKREKVRQWESIYLD